MLDKKKIQLLENMIFKCTKKSDNSNILAKNRGYYGQ